MLCTLVRYAADGHCKGEVTEDVMSDLFQLYRLQWNIPEACQEVIQSSLRTAEAVANDVDLHIEVILFVFGLSILSLFSYFVNRLILFPLIFINLFSRLTG